MDVSLHDSRLRVRCDRWLIEASLPNEWSPDSANEALVNDVPLFGMKGAKLGAAYPAIG